MRILYIAGNPQSETDLQIDKEINLLREEIDKIDTSEVIDLRVYSYLRVSELPTILKMLKPDILHFAAHGHEQGIVLAHEERGSVILTSDMLVDLLSSLKVEPALIVINACNSETMAAQIASERTFVIGTDATLTNVAARSMTAALYRRLADAGSIAEAFQAASVIVRLIDLGQVSAKLFPVGSEVRAQRTRIANPLRIVACLPEIDEWIGRGLSKPLKSFRPESPVVQFGIAGTPPGIMQTIFFTDDESVVPRGKGSLEEARCWLVEDRGVKGEIWMPSEFEYWGDMSWFACVTTGERDVFCASTSTTEALRRYYFEEEWRGKIPDAFADVIRLTISNLIDNDGSRRAKP